MKKLFSFEKAITDNPDNGAKAVAGLSVEKDQLVIHASVNYPIAKIIEPATKALDGLLDKIKTAIPGTWDDELITKLKGEYKSELLKLLSEPKADVTPA